MSEVVEVTEMLRREPAPGVWTLADTVALLQLKAEVSGKTHTEVTFAAWEFAEPRITRGKVLEILQKVAEILGTSRGSIKRARDIVTYDKEHGTNIKQQVLDGKKSLKGAHDAFNNYRAKPKDKLAATTTKEIVKEPAKPKFLTREEVDPDFVGTDAEFKARYGHVWVKTAIELANESFPRLAVALDRKTIELLQCRDVDPAKLASVKTSDVLIFRRGLGRLEKFVGLAKEVLAKADQLLGEAHGEKPDTDSR